MGRESRRKREWRASGHGERLRDAVFGPRTYPHTVNVQGRVVTIHDDYPLHIEYRSGRGELLAELREVRGHYLVTAILTGALAVLAREATLKGATEGDVRALIADEHAAITEALYGQPTTESRARMVARAVEVVGCRVEVVPC